MGVGQLQYFVHHFNENGWGRHERSAYHSRLHHMRIAPISSNALDDLLRETILLVG